MRRVVPLRWEFWSGKSREGAFFDRDGGPGGEKEFEDKDSGNPQKQRRPKGFKGAAASKGGPGPSAANPNLMRGPRLRPPPVGMVLERLASFDSFPCIHFVFSRKGCEEAAGGACRWLTRGQR